MRVAILALLILFQPAAASRAPNCWKGITPLRSTCEDVKRILKVDKCTFPRSEYTLPDFRVLVQFENDECAHNPKAWRVPVGTVTAVVLSPRKEFRPSDFGLELSKYERQEHEDMVGVEIYYGPKDGVTVEMYRGIIQTLFLYPLESQRNLRCMP